MIEELLKPGKENAISTEALLAMIGATNARELRLIVARERKAGAVILFSCSGGYYLPGSPAEVAEFIRTEDKKARSIMRALKSARRYMKQTQTEGQLTITE